MHGKLAPLGRYRSIPAPLTAGIAEATPLWTLAARASRPGGQRGAVAGWQRAPVW